MPATKTYWWTTAPFLRLFPALAAGILLQWFFAVSFWTIALCASAALLLFIGVSFLPLKHIYEYNWLRGCCLYVLLAATGAGLTRQHNIKNNPHWLGHAYQTGNFVVATLQEPPVEKPNSYKALASATLLGTNDSCKKVTGRIILYFHKGVDAALLTYGTQVVLQKPLQPIRNSGNPGAFDYQRYCLFQGITHQVFLGKNEFALLPEKDRAPLQDFLIRSRRYIVGLLQQYIGGAKEQGLAEALLIGYKDDLDKSLVQAYSNTGVVHVIAISGLHLGLIYMLLLLLAKPLKRLKKLRGLRFLLVVCGLWAFALLAGAQPSVLRSAVMFSCLALGELMDRKASVYNTLALSAFVLLCSNPFWLWDVGFQLSYAAVLSIVLFFRPIYTWLYFPNKAVDGLWKLTAVTLAAQILTLPFGIYHFHQFPLLFLFANLVAVPLSGIILFGEILLCVVAFVRPLALFLGTVLEWLIRLMNGFIERMDAVPFALWNGFSLSVLQVVLLFVFMGGVGYWLMERQTKALQLALLALLVFVALRTQSFLQAKAQQKLIVYNVPKHQAIDVINGRQAFFVGDAALLQENFLRNFHLQPSRIRHRLKHVAPFTAKQFRFCNTTIFVVDTALPKEPVRVPADVVILSKKPRLFVRDVVRLFSPKLIVLDGAVPPWKARQWKQECDSLRLPVHDTAEQGAFVLDF